MPNWQHAFLSKVILEHETKAAVGAGITPAFFRDEQYQRVYEFVLDHWNRHGVAADADVVRTAYPSLTWKPQGQPIGYLIEQMRSDRKLVLLTKGMTEAAAFMQEEKADEMYAALHEAMIQARLETSASQDIDFTKMRAAIEELLLDRMENPGVLRGISSGFDGIDYVTGGWQPEQFVVLIGTPKSFKSATLLAMALAAHRQAKVPLFVGFEMSNVEQTDRLASLISGVSLTRIMRGSLSTLEEKSIVRAMKTVEEMRPFLFSTDITSATTISGVQAKVLEYQPDVVFVDGAYLMQSEKQGVIPGTPQAMTDVSRSLKRMAQSQRLPVVVTTQASLPRARGGINISAAMYTQAWGQDCDVLLGVERQREEAEGGTDTGQARVMFKVLESRSGPRKQVVLEWDWNQGTVRELDPAQMRGALDRSRHSNVFHDDGSGETWPEEP